MGATGKEGIDEEMEFIYCLEGRKAGREGRNVPMGKTPPANI